MMATQRERETDKKNTHTQPINKNPKLDEVKIFVDIPTYTHTYIHTYTQMPKETRNVDGSK